MAATMARRRTGTVPVMDVRMDQFDEDGNGFLAGRLQGANARHEIESRAARLMDDGQAIALDFEGIAFLAISFADACVAQLLTGRLGGYYETHPFVVLNAAEDVRETLDLTLERRGLVALSLAETVDLLGGSQELALTARAAHQLERFRVSDLATKLGISPQVANNRLRALVKNGVLGRRRIVPEGGGKEFEYFVPTSTAPQLAKRRSG